jgi:hypothetical protein
MGSRIPLACASGLYGIADSSRLRSGLV